MLDDTVLHGPDINWSRRTNAPSHLRFLTYQLVSVWAPLSEFSWNPGVVTTKSHAVSFHSREWTASDPTRTTLNRRSTADTDASTDDNQVTGLARLRAEHVNHR